VNPLQIRNVHKVRIKVGYDFQVAVSQPDGEALAFQYSILHSNFMKHQRQWLSGIPGDNLVLICVLPEGRSTRLLDGKLLP
jgi:hypothetical protein